MTVVVVVVEVVEVAMGNGMRWRRLRPDKRFLTRLLVCGNSPAIARWLWEG